MIERYAARVSGANTFIKEKARESAHNSSHHRHASSACRGRYQDNPAWLGHVSLNTTNIYAEVDLEMKAKALTTCQVPLTKPVKRWREGCRAHVILTGAIGHAIGNSRMKFSRPATTTFKNLAIAKNIHISSREQFHCSAKTLWLKGMGPQRFAG